MLGVLDRRVKGDLKRFRRASRNTARRPADGAAGSPFAGGTPETPPGGMVTPTPSDAAVRRESLGQLPVGPVDRRHG